MDKDFEKMVINLKKLCELKEELSLWNRSEDLGKLRVYIKCSRKDATAYADFCFDGFGFTLKVFLKNCGQRTNWYISQANIIKENLSEIYCLIEACTFYNIDRCLASYNEDFQKTMEGGLASLKELFEKKD